MSVNDPDVDTRELADLQDLVRAEGFRRFQAHVEQEWGDAACIRKIDEVLRQLTPGDRPAEQETVLQVRAAARQIQALVRWPEDRISQLQGQKPKAVSPLERLRRIAR